MAFAFLFWEISHLGDSGMHLGRKGRGGVSGGVLLREFQLDLHWTPRLLKARKALSSLKC